MSAANAALLNVLSVQSFYFEDKPAMSNEEFDNLKEELLWEGSKVAVLRQVTGHVLLYVLLSVLVADILVVWLITHMIILCRMRYCGKYESLI